MKKYRVLLISPVRNVDVMCGDVIYTEFLCEHAPDHIEYVTYDQALANEDIIERKRLRFLWRNFKYSKRWFIADIIPSLSIFLINIFRRKGWLIANPWKYFHVFGDFDLIHIHVFPVRVTGRDIPVVVSNAAFASDFLRNVNLYSLLRIRVMETLEKILCLLFGMQETTYRIQNATRMIVFSQYLKNKYIAYHRQVPPIDVIPIGMPEQPIDKGILKNDKIVMGFIAKDFKAKGGEEVIAAYRKIYETNKKIQLVIIGSPPQFPEEELKALNIEWHEYVQRDILLSTFFPRFDIFVYPTRADGFPLVVIEALSFGIPVLTSDYMALPEMIGNGEAGETCRTHDAQSVEQALLTMLDVQYLNRKRDEVQRFFKNHYDINTVFQQITQTYKHCISR